MKSLLFILFLFSFFQYASSTACCCYTLTPPYPFIASGGPLDGYCSGAGACLAHTGGTPSFGVSFTGNPNDCPLQAPSVPWKCCCYDKIPSDIYYILDKEVDGHCDTLGSLLCGDLAFGGISYIGYCPATVLNAPTALPTIQPTPFPIAVTLSPTYAPLPTARYENPCTGFQSKCLTNPSSCPSGESSPCFSGSPCDSNDCLVIDHIYEEDFYIGGISDPSGNFHWYSNAACLYFKSGGMISRSVYAVELRNGNQVWQASTSSICIFKEPNSYLRTYIGSFNADVFYDSSDVNMFFSYFVQQFPGRAINFAPNARYIFIGNNSQVIIEDAILDANILSDASLTIQICDSFMVSRDFSQIISFSQKQCVFVDNTFLYGRIDLEPANNTCIRTTNTEFRASLSMFVGCDTFNSLPTKNPCNENRPRGCNTLNEKCIDMDDLCSVDSPCNDDNCIFIDYEDFGTFYEEFGAFYLGIPNTEGEVLVTSNSHCIYIGNGGSINSPISAHINNTVTSTQPICIFVEDGGKVKNITTSLFNDIIYMENSVIFTNITNKGGIDSVILKDMDMTTSSLTSLTNVKIDMCSVTGSMRVTALNTNSCIAIEDSSLSNVNFGQHSTSTCHLPPRFLPLPFMLGCKTIFPPLLTKNPCDGFTSVCSYDESCTPLDAPCHINSTCNSNNCLLIDYLYDDYLYLGFTDTNIRATSNYTCVYVTAGGSVSNIIQGAFQNRHSNTGLCIFIDNALMVGGIRGSPRDDVIYIANTVASNSYAITGYGSDIADIIIIHNSIITDYTGGFETDYGPILLDMCNSIMNGTTEDEAQVSGTGKDDCISIVNSEIPFLKAGSGNDVCYIADGLKTITSHKSIPDCEDNTYVEYVPSGVRDLDSAKDECIGNPWKGEIPDRRDTIINEYYQDHVPETRVKVRRKSNSCFGCPLHFVDKHCTKTCLRSGGTAYSYTSEFSVTNKESSVELSIPEGGRCTSRESFVMIVNATRCTSFSSFRDYEFDCVSLSPLHHTLQITPTNLSHQINPGISVHSYPDKEHSFFVLRANCLPAGATITFDMQVEGCSNAKKNFPKEPSCIDVTATLITGRCQNLIGSWLRCEPNNYGILIFPNDVRKIAYPYDYTKCFFKSRDILQQQATRLSAFYGSCPTNCSSATLEDTVVQNFISSGKHSKYSKRTLLLEQEDAVYSSTAAIPAKVGETEAGPVVYIHNNIGMMDEDEVASCLYSQDTRILNETTMERFRCINVHERLPILSRVRKMCEKSDRTPRILRLSASITYFSNSDGYEAASIDQEYVKGKAKIDIGRYQPNITTASYKIDDEMPLCIPMYTLFDFKYSNNENVEDVIFYEPFIDNIETSHSDFNLKQELARIDRLSAIFSFDKLFLKETLTVNIYYASCDLDSERFKPKLSVRITLLETNAPFSCNSPGARPKRCTDKLQINADGYDADIGRSFIGCSDMRYASSFINSRMRGNSSSWYFLNMILVVTCFCVCICALFIFCKTYKR